MRASTARRAASSEGWAIADLEAPPTQQEPLESKEVAPPVSIGHDAKCRPALGLTRVDDPERLFHQRDSTPHLRMSTMLASSACDSMEMVAYCSTWSLKAPAFLVMRPEIFFDTTCSWRFSLKRSLSSSSNSSSVPIIF